MALRREVLEGRQFHFPSHAAPMPRRPSLQWSRATHHVLRTYLSQAPLPPFYVTTFHPEPHKHAAHHYGFSLYLSPARQTPHLVPLCGQHGIVDGPQLRRRIESCFIGDNCVIRPPSRLSSFLIRLHSPFLAWGSSYVAHSPPFIIPRPLHQGYKQGYSSDIADISCACFAWLGGMRLLLGSEARGRPQTVPGAEKLGGRYHASLVVPERGQVPRSPK